jgi:tRNA U38,U39,U40 pseudouridine synthase TruA
MVADYKKCKNSLTVAKKYSVSHPTVLKWSQSENLENKSSAPKVPFRKHSVRKLVLIHFLYKKELKNLDDIEEILEEQDQKMPRSSI